MKSGRLWIAFVVALLVGNAVAMGILIAEAGDPTPRVLPDYYRKAVAWDETVAARRASAELGWAAQASLSDGRAIVVLVDDHGAAVTGATVEMTIRHRSRADRQLTVALVESGPGRYLARFAAAQIGLHEVEVSATRDGDRFVYATVVEP